MPQETPQLRLFLEDADAIDELFRQALKAKGSVAFLDFLQFVKRFNRFSVFNALLIHVQRPGAQAVGSRAQWRRIGRSVNADAVPVIVLRPFGPVSFLYELADTAGAPLPGQDADPLLAYGVVPPTTWSRTVAAATKCGVKVEEVANYGAGLSGTATALHQDSTTDSNKTGEALWRVRVNGRLDDATRLATLAHELGHIYCGHVGPDPKNRWPNRRSLGEAQRELEAEGTAWLVCQRAGIETWSAEYLNRYAAGAPVEEPLKRVSVFLILAAANRIEARGDRASGPGQ
jgi:hypothetical protein